MVLLNALKHGETYGYELVQRLAKLECLALGEGTVYPLFARLVESKHISTRVEESDAGRPRRYYRLTKLGELRLRAMDEYWREVVNSIERLKENKA